ncbi:hypothetical protein GGS21DRAFT_53103 [Xylaria nigripes]|nr:hypothetical protein GGS21DRAFT_53103 [Xylaria nigripes]
MPRPSEAEGAKISTTTRDKTKVTIPGASNNNNNTSRGFRRQRTRSTVFNRRTRNTPTKPASLISARSSFDPSVPTSTRKVSASFSTNCPLSGHPTIACSTVTVSTRMNHPGPLTSHPVRRSSALPSSQTQGSIYVAKRDKSINTSKTYSNLPIPTDKSRAPAPKASVATGYTNAVVIAPCNTENIPPGASIASLRADKHIASNNSMPTPAHGLATKKSKFRPEIPRSRTFNVLSNLTASISRPSLSFPGSDSRRNSTSSKSTIRKDPALYMNAQSASSASSQAIANQVDKGNPRQVHKAQSSAYWAGRFMALQDRFQSEMLLPENLTTLVTAHAKSSLLPVTQPSLASSATTGCIAPPTKSKSKLMTITNKSTSPHKPQQQRKAQSKPVCKAALKSLATTAMIASVQPSKETAVAMLVDDDNRCRRIFSHLDALCTTSEARMSLREWQQGYARRMGKESLLPKGGTMKGTARESTWVGRLFTRSSSGHLKRGSLGLRAAH